jgi:hypothetical protein
VKKFRDSILFFGALALGAWRKKAHCAANQHLHGAVLLELRLFY